MSAAYIDGAYRCYALVDGRKRHYLSCAHERPRQAIAHVTPSYTTPLRASTEASTADPRTPPDGRVRSDASVESRERGSGLKDRPAK